MLKSNRITLFTVLVLLIAVVGGTVFAVPGSFNLLGPGEVDAPGPELVEPTGAVDITWEEATGATSYTFTLNYPVAEPLVLSGLTPADGDDDLTCADDGNGNIICTLSIAAIEGVLTEEGQYSWDVVATDGADTSSNGSFYFTVDLTPAAAAFDLVSPADATEITDVAAAATATVDVTWNASDEAAVTYTWEIISPSEVVTSVVELAPGDICAGDPVVCTLNLDEATVLATLVQNGTYSWNVYAVASDSDETAAANGPFTLIVNDPLFELPGDFTLTGPASGSFVRDLAGVTQIDWAPAVGATTYDFTLFKISNNTSRLGVVAVVEGLTPAAADDDLTCDDTSCVFTVDFAAVVGPEGDGTFAWTVDAVNDNGANEASNAPYFFEVNTGVVSLVSNGGFEVLNFDGSPVDWTLKDAVNGNKVKCNKTDKAYTPFGECAYQFKAGTGTKVQQDVDTSVLLDGDTLSFSMQLDPRGAAAGTKVGTAKLKFSDDSTLKIHLSVPAAALRAVEDYVEVSASEVLDLSTLTVASGKVQFKNRLTSSKLLFDEVVLTAEQVAAPVAEALPLPAAPGTGGFRK